MKWRRLMAVDPSLTCSGWAFFEVHSRKLVAVGKVRSLDPSQPLATRLADLQKKIARIMEELILGPDDYVICEAPTTMRDPLAAIKVEQVRGIFEAVARMRSAQVPGRLNPRTVHHQVLGLGGKQLPRIEVKRVAVEVAHRLFAEPLRTIGFESTLPNLKRNQDIVDAMLLGHLGLTSLQSAVWADMQPEELLHRRAFRKTAS